MRATGLKPRWFGKRRHSTIATPQRLTPWRTLTSCPNTVTWRPAVTGFGAAKIVRPFASGSRCGLEGLHVGDTVPGDWPLDVGASATVAPGQADDENRDDQNE